MANTFQNESIKDKSYRVGDIEIRLCRLSEAADCEFGGNSIIGKYSSIRNTKLSGYNSLGCHSFANRCIIGKYTTIGSRVSIGGFEHPNNWLSVSEFQYRDTLECYGENGIQDDENEILLMTPTLIGNDVWIGDNTFIKSGTKIGHRSIIGAGSVVTKSVPNYSIYVGNPAKLFRKRFPAEVCQKLLESAWWELSITELKNLALNYSNIEDCLNKIMKYKSDKFVY